MTYSSTVLALPGLLGYWRLGEASGAVAVDASGNGRNGSYLNTPTLGSTGLLTGDADTAMTTAANSGQCMSVASATWMNTTNISVACRVKLTSALDTLNGDAIVTRYHNVFPWMLWRHNSQGAFAVQLNASGNVWAPSAPVLNQTYSVGFTYDQANVRLYVDGVQVASAPFTQALATGTVPLEIGRYSQAATTTPGMVVDEVSVANAVWTASDFANLHAAATAAPITGVLAATLPMPQVAFEGAAPEVHTGTLDVVLPMPTVTFEGNNTVGTDISNRDWARRRGGIGLVTVETPVAPVPPTRTRAPRVTKAVPLPTPTMVDGRPT